MYLTQVPLIRTGHPNIEQTILYTFLATTTTVTFITTHALSRISIATAIVFKQRARDDVTTTSSSPVRQHVERLPTIQVSRVDPEEADVIIYGVGVYRVGVGARYVEGEVLN